MSDFSKRLTMLRQSRGLTQDQLAKQLHLSRSAIGMYERGEREPNNLELLNSLADFFGVNIDYLIGRNDSLSAAVSASKGKPVKIPVLGHVAAGIPLEAVENIEGTEEISAAMVKDGSEYFGLKIHGDSMSPRMKEGDVVIVRKQDDAESGDIVIALVNGNEATCKRLKKYSDRIALISFNPEYDPMVFTPEDVEKKPVRIIGKVVELRAKF